MWALVAKVMGFSVIRMWWADPRFEDLMCRYGIRAKTSKLGKYRTKPRNIELVFCDADNWGPINPGGYPGGKG